MLGVYEDTLHAFSKGVIPEDIFPPLQYFWESSKMKKLKHAFDEIMNKFLRKKYYEHVETFDKGSNRVNNNITFMIQRVLLLNMICKIWLILKLYMNKICFNIH